MVMVGNYSSLLPFDVSSNSFLKTIFCKQKKKHKYYHRNRFGTSNNGPVCVLMLVIKFVSTYILLKCLPNKMKIIYKFPLS